MNSGVLTSGMDEFGRLGINFIYRTRTSTSIALRTVLTDRQPAMAVGRTRTYATTGLATGTGNNLS
jgi:hypothetical protein